MKRIIFNFCFVWLAVSAFAGSKVVEMRNYGLVPDTHENLSPKLQKALQDIKSQVALGDKVTLLFESGRYDFHPEGAAVREYYISNHDQDNPKTVGFPLEDWKGLTVDGQGADFIFHGRMLPLSLLRSENCTLRNFSIDFETPHIAQVKILESVSMRKVFSKHTVKAGPVLPREELLLKKRQSVWYTAPVTYGVLWKG